MGHDDARNASLSAKQLERLWEEHLKGEFDIKDVEATLATMVDDAYVNHMPVNTGGRGRTRSGRSIETTSSPRGLTISRRSR